MTTTVFAAILNVKKSIAEKGVGKKKGAGLSYEFRGVDDVVNALSPLTAEAGLIIAPRIEERASEWRDTKSGGKMCFVTLKVAYDFISAEDGSIYTAISYGEGSDVGDKATSKALSSAYKSICVQTFCIPTDPMAADVSTLAFANSVDRDNFYKDMLTALESAESVEALEQAKDAGAEKLALMGASPNTDDQETLTLLRIAYKARITALKPKTTRKTVDDMEE